MMRLVDAVIRATLGDSGVNDKPVARRPVKKEVWDKSNEPSRWRVWVAAVLDQLPDPKRNS